MLNDAILYWFCVSNFKYNEQVTPFKLEKKSDTI